MEAVAVQAPTCIDDQLEQVHELDFLRTDAYKGRPLVQVVVSVVVLVLDLGFLNLFSIILSPVELLFEDSIGYNRQAFFVHLLLLAVDLLPQGLLLVDHGLVASHLDGGLFIVFLILQKHLHLLPKQDLAI